MNGSEPEAGPGGVRSHADRVSVGHSLGLVILAVAVFVLYSFGLYAAFTSRWQGGSDFFPRWSGAQMLFLEGKSPYSLEATQRTQRALYNGRLAREDEDQVAFAYPIYAVYFVAPLIFLSYAQALAVWMVMLQFALCAMLGLCMSLYGWRPAAWLTAATGLWMILNYNSGEAIIVGQLGVIVALMVTLALWSLHAGRDWWAGAFLALSTIKPQMVFLIIPLLLLWSLTKRRWGVALGFGLAMIALAGSGWLLVPDWIVQSIAGMQQYARYTAYGGPSWLLTEYYFPFLGRPANIALTLALVGYLAWQWRAVWGLHMAGRGMRIPQSEISGAECGRPSAWPSLWWVTGLTLIVTQLIAPHTATANYVILYIPVLFAFSVLDRQFRFGRWYILAFELGSLVGFWTLFALTVVPERGGNLPQEDPIMYLPLPLLLLLAFILGRSRLMRVEGG